MTVSMTRGATGNPLVDWGLYVAAAMANREGVASFSDDDLKGLISAQATEIARIHQKLDAFIPIFGSNTPLHNPKKKNQPPGKAHQDAYAGLLKELAGAIGNEQGQDPCEACGRPRSVLPTQVKQAPPVFGRDWFPLAGAKSEANLLPAASRGPRFCARCLVSVRLLPSAVFIVDGRMTVLQSMPPAFAEIFARDLYEHVRAREGGGDASTVGKKEGAKALLARLLSLLQRLRVQQRLVVVDARTRVFSWQFSNAGDKADVVLQEIPNRALIFLRDAVGAGLRSEIDRLVQREGGKDSERTPSLMRCLMRGSDYEPLYPWGPHPGASVQLFELYQQEVLGRSKLTLAWAWHIGAGIRQRAAVRKDLANLRKPEAFYSPELRSQVRASLTDQALAGEMGLPQYLAVFPRRPGSPVAVDGSGWGLLRFYANQVGPGGVPFPPAADAHFEEELVQFVADRMLARILVERDHPFARKHAVRRLGSEGPRWLAEQFRLCALREAGFTYRTWASLTEDPTGENSTWEWAFQTRLAFAARLAETATTSSSLPDEHAEEPRTLLTDSLLPETCARWLRDRLVAFRQGRGQRRLEVEIARPASRGQIDMPLRILASIGNGDDPARIDWEAWLESRGGQQGRLQLSLAIANAVRRLGSGSAIYGKEERDDR